MELLFWGALVSIVLFLFFGRKRKPKAGSGFDGEKRQLALHIGLVEPEDDSDKGLLIRELYAWTLERLLLLLPRVLSAYKGKRITEDMRHCIGLECAIYLYFRSDVLIFNAGVPDSERMAYEKLVHSEVLNSFKSDKDDISALIDSRFNDYTASYQSKSTYRSPEAILIENLLVVARTGDLNRSLAIPIQGAFEQIFDVIAITSLPHLWLFSDCIIAGMTSERASFTEMDSGLLRALMCQAALKAKEPDLSPKKRSKEPTPV